MLKFKTLKRPGQAERSFRNSTFIGYAFPISDEDDAKIFIKKIKDRHNDADHNVSAYRINKGDVLAMKYDDDGEPAGSSGKPVFKILEMKDLSNVVVIVSRYFGGVKLGFGGLTRAYRETAIEAIENAGITLECEKTILKIEANYSDMDVVSRTVNQYGNILKTDYSCNVNCEIEVEVEQVDELIEKIKNITSNRVTIK